MDLAWESRLLQPVPVTPRRLARQVAHDLGESSAAVVEVVQLHLEALDAALLLDAPELLADQLRWQDVRLRAAGVPFGAEAVDGAVVDALRRRVTSAEIDEVEQVQHAAAALREGASVTDEVLELPPGPAHDYLLSTLSGNRDAAITIIRDAMLADTSVATIMMDILQPAQVELGRLWEAGEISIAHEHLTTAVTQTALSLLYPRLQLNRTWSGCSVVATSVGTEAHEVGIRMISDLLEHAGWRAAYLGADVPNQDVVDRVAQYRADVLAVSAMCGGCVSWWR
jgi:methanogenic corrinoid protein MtbC1